MSAVALEGLAFTSDLLDGIRSGTIELSVPLRHDVIQVGAGGHADIGRIRVVKCARTLVVSRVDGRPIQVVIVTDDPDLVTTVGYRPHTSRVFVEPVTALRLRRIRDARWYPVGGRIAACPSRVKQFVDVISTFAQAKQEREANESAFAPRMA